MLKDQDILDGNAKYLLCIIPVLISLTIIEAAPICLAETLSKRRRLLTEDEKRI